jgi:hypothetical protein
MKSSSAGAAEAKTLAPGEGPHRGAVSGGATGPMKSTPGIQHVDESGTGD